MEKGFKRLDFQLTNVCSDVRVTGFELFLKVDMNQENEKTLKGTRVLTDYYYP